MSFRDLEIDHIIPESISLGQLTELTVALGLGDNFSIDSVTNLVPTHHSCNARKSDTLFSESGIRYYMEIWYKKQAKVSAELELLEKQAANEEVLIPLAAKIQRSGMTFFEAVSFLRHALSDRPGVPSEPTIVTFGTNLSERGISPTPEAYDKLEKALLEYVYGNIPCPASMTEASMRTGETLSVRMAFWLFDVNRLQRFRFPGWEVTEVARYSDLYS